MTSSNKPSVLRVLCQNLNELKEQESANTPQKKLARVQALFLYQIICLFDGDLTLRSNADRTMPLLLDWLDELCKIRENDRVSEHANAVEMRADPNSQKLWEVSILENIFSLLAPISFADIQSGGYSLSQLDGPLL